MRYAVRQALLRPAFAQLYRGIPADEWQSAAVMTDLVLAMRLRAKSGAPPTRDRVLDPAHFEFREVASSGSPAPRAQPHHPARHRRATD